MTEQISNDKKPIDSKTVDRKSNIRELEDKKRLLREGRNRLLEGLGETLMLRIGEDNPFPETQGDSPAAILAGYRKLQKEIADSAGMIKSLEEDIVRLKELEEMISAREEEESLLVKELDLLYVNIGMALLKDPDLNNLAVFVKQQEETLLGKIEEHEKTLEELVGQKGGIFSWLGKNAKIAVEKAFLSRARSDLQKLYRSTGEEYISSGKAEDAAGVEDAGKAFELKDNLSSLQGELNSLKEERRRKGGLFGTESSPSRRIQGLKKQILLKKKDLPAIYLRLGNFAALRKGEEEFSSLVTEDDLTVLEKAEAIASEISGIELSIEKIKAAISIDDEKAGIEKMEKAILNQRQKITAAEEAIDGLEKQIAESERQIDKLSAFIQGDHGGEN